jgi:prophage regulatory protein
MISPLQPTRGIPIKVVADRLGISRASIYERLDPRSPRHDPSLPVPFKSGGRTLWVDAEIEAHLQFKMATCRIR